MTLSCSFSVRMLGFRGRVYVLGLGFRVSVPLNPSSTVFLIVPQLFFQSFVQGIFLHNPDPTPWLHPHPGTLD